MKEIKFLFFSILMSSLCLSQSAVLAARDDIDRPLPKGDKMDGDAPRVQDYDEIVSPDMESATSLAQRARVSLKNGNVTRALSLARRAMKLDDDDIDVHLIYAEALEAKIERQTDKNPDLFRKCIHEWVLVYRNEVGMEKGMTFKGLNPLGNFYNDDEHGNLAKKHLIKLTGYAPKVWETDNHYYTRVFKPAETAVSAKIKPAASTSTGESERPAKPARSPQPEE